MKIGLTYNLKKDHAPSPGQPADRFEEFDSEETIVALETALRGLGHEPVRFGWGPSFFDLVTTTPVDGVLNIAEGFGGRGRESQVPAFLEMAGIPCTGSDPLTIAVTLDKAMAKRVAQAAGIPTAPFAVARREEQLKRIDLRYPVFVKPAGEGSSMGISADSRCLTAEDLLRVGRRLLHSYGPVLVEEFLPGDEYTVGMIDGEVIGVMQVVPRSTAETFVYSLEVKRDYRNRVEYRLVDNPEAAAVARAVWEAFRLQDVARVDVRCDSSGRPNFVEVNPLPGVHPVDSDLVLIARDLGWSHQELIGRILDAARKRWGR